MKTFILVIAFAFIGFSESQRIVIEERERAPRPARPAAAEAAEYGPPKPYNFEYNNQDPEGNQQYHSESGDQNGEKKGTFGYQDVNGVYRIVDYTAGAAGYRATIRTNEPGTGKHENGDPADTVFEVQPPPPGVQPLAAEGERRPAAPTRRPVAPPAAPTRPARPGPRPRPGGERIIIEEGGRRPTIIIEEGARG
ncbi:Cuticle protein 16.8-like protein [Dinothrombium tinctorium]|uniref:Cuticle protein 16.8-like protein n=1 Tax=Dinothrombium tinctorium TaxID=1965070 RepID=A0A443RQP1_9ACAR|nr:Cuticle protein 16.8-like protein [Dinothrombium tinctorium]RWS17575.1 Cuticle protein 16.8-like protein [Dinothrombium tinctorium]RWS17664.1 Cuticle protein 16.8-like protein [Dinothrombium tinctorium]